MIAAVIVPSSPFSFLVGLAVTIAAAVLAAQWGAYRPQVKRIVAAGLLALFVGGIGAAVARASDEDDPDFVMMNPCKRYTPSDWQYWAEGCWLP